MMHSHQKQSGFALLMTLIVVSIVLAIGLSLLDITLKQLELSGTARDSEIAFHAAYAGAECAQYWRLQSIISDATIVTPPDFGWCVTGAVAAAPQFDLAPNITHSTYEIDSGASCIEIDMYVFDARTAAVAADIPDLTPGTDEVCLNGVCTFVLSRGYNRSCLSLVSTRTIQREIFVKF